jgi:hypothetical protein
MNLNGFNEVFRDIACSNDVRSLVMDGFDFVTTYQQKRNTLFARLRREKIPD